MEIIERSVRARVGVYDVELPTGSEFVDAQQVGPMIKLYALAPESVMGVDEYKVNVTYTGSIDKMNFLRAVKVGDRRVFNICYINLGPKELKASEEFEGFEELETE